MSEEHHERQKMIPVFQGLPLVSGKAHGCIVRGGAHLHEAGEGQEVHHKGSYSPPEEMMRYKKALTRSCDLLQQEHSRGKDAKQIILAVVDVLNDPLLKKNIHHRIHEQHYSARRALNEAVSLWADSVDNEEIVREVKGIAGLVLSQMSPTPSVRMASREDDFYILVVSSLSIADLVSPMFSKVCGVISTHDSPYSHVTIVLQSRGIPYVTGVELPRELTETHPFISLDGDKGEVKLFSSASEQSGMQGMKRKARELRTTYLRRLLKMKDQTRLALLGSINIFNEFKNLPQHKVQGVGLVRSEYFILQEGGGFLSEEGQVLIYEQFAQCFLSWGSKHPSLGKKPLMIRLFDRNFEQHGARGVQWLLENQEFLQQHILAILKGTVSLKRLRIIVPMVSEAMELVEIRSLVNRLQREISSSTKVELGCMIEVPAAALRIHALAEEAHFFALGTNDLAQNLFGTDRINTFFCDSLDASLIFLLDHVVTASRNHGVPLFSCGAINIDPVWIPLLIGVGLREFSISLPNVARFRSYVSQLSGSWCKELVRRVHSSYSRKETVRLMYDALSEWSSSAPLEQDVRYWFDKRLNLLQQKDQFFSSLETMGQVIQNTNKQKT